VLYQLAFRPHLKGDAPAGDAAPPPAQAELAH
jgi:hypothetical protein